MTDLQRSTFNLFVIRNADYGLDSTLKCLALLIA